MGKLSGVAGELERGQIKNLVVHFLDEPFEVDLTTVVSWSEKLCVISKGP